MAPLKGSIKWAHAVNDIEKLHRILDSINDINAIEADIIFSEKQSIPVMGHPPMTDNPLLSLSLFLDKVQHLLPSHVIKLDFKSFQAYKRSLSIIQPYNHENLWINADILPGSSSYEDTTEDAVEFVSKAIESTPDAALSIGWKLSTDDAFSGTFCYTEEMIDRMLHRVLQLSESNVIKQKHITFPICANINFKSSWPALKKLLDASPNYTLTLWWSKDDRIKELITTLVLPTLEGDSCYKDRTYYDIGSSNPFS